jgi:hypothetical protein
MSNIELCKCSKSKSKVKGVRCGPHVYGIRSWRAKTPTSHETKVDEVYCLDTTCKELKNKWILETEVRNGVDFSEVTFVTKYQNGEKYV